jgi:hypothetical protein
MFDSLFGRLFQRRSSRSAGGRRLTRAKPPRYRPMLEELETRTVHSAITWLHPVSGDWDDPTNWSGNHVPTATDSAFIPFAGITVTHAATAADAVSSLNSQAAIDLSAGSLAISAGSAGTSRIDGMFTVSGGTLTLEGTLNGRGTLRNLATVNIGTNAFSGSVINTPIQNDAPSATINIMGQTTVVSAFTNQGQIAINGDLAIASGTLVNAPGATINVAGSLDGNLDNQGNITSARAFIGGTSTTVANEGTISVGDTGRFNSVTVASSAFTNTGTVTLTVANSTFAVNGGTFENDGSIAGPGTLSLQHITTTLTPDQVSAVGALSFTNSTITSAATLTNQPLGA